MANTSLLPEDYLENRIERRTNMTCLTLFVVVSIAIVGAYIVRDRQRKDVTRQHVEINMQFEEAARRLTQLDELQSQKKMMIRKARVTAELLERVPRSLILSEMINNMPSSMSLLSVDLQTKIVKKAPRPTTALDLAKKKRPSKIGQNDQASDKPVKISEVEVHLTGVAPTDVDVATFMHDVGSSPMFDNVHLVFSEQVKIDDQQLRKFRVQMKLRQDVNVHQVEPKLVRRALQRNPMLSPGDAVAGADR